MPAHTVVELHIELPRKEAYAQLAHTRKKPMAAVQLILDDAPAAKNSAMSRMLWVPVRVARALRKDHALPLPLSVSDTLSAIEELEGRLCFSTLAETLEHRDLSSAEMRAKLKSLGYPEHNIDAAITHALELNFLNDTRYMLHFIEARTHRGWGRRKIEFELAQKGLDPSQLEDYPDAFFSEEADQTRAEALLVRRAPAPARPHEKYVRYLVGKGFSYAVARAAAHKRLDEVSKGTDEPSPH